MALVQAELKSLSVKVVVVLLSGAPAAGVERQRIEVGGDGRRRGGRQGVDAGAVAAEAAAAQAFRWRQLSLRVMVSVSVAPLLVSAIVTPDERRDRGVGGGGMGGCRSPVMVGASAADKTKSVPLAPSLRRLKYSLENEPPCGRNL